MERLLRKFTTSVAWSAGLVIALMGIQLLLQNFVRMLGQDMSSLSDGVVKNYPSIAAGEALKILCTMTLVLLPVVLILQKSWANRKTLDTNRWFYLTILALGGSFFAVLLASFMQFPALYENYAPEFIRQTIFLCSQLITPTILNTTAAICLVAALFTATLPASTAEKILFFVATVLAILAIIAIEKKPSIGKYIHDKNRPNILFIAADSLRFDKSLDTALMPNIRKLRDFPETVSFSDHQVGIPRTFPSWVEILQGNYGAVTGIRHMFPSLIQLRKKGTTLPHILDTLGYETSVVSDFAGDIFPRFDTGFQVVKAPAMNLRTMIQVNMDVMFPLFFPVLLTHAGRTFFSSLDESPSFADPEWLAQKAVATLDQTANKPFFMTIFFSTAHFPYAAPWPYYSKRSNKKYQGPYKFQKNPDINGKGAEISEEDVSQVRALYDGGLSAIDFSIGTIFDELEERGLLKDTMIIITADHGEDLFDSGKVHGHGEHLIGDKVLHVPWLLKFPGTTAVKSREIATLSRSIDIAPTILDFLGQSHSTMKGISHLPEALQGTKQDTPDGAYSETGIWFSNKGSSHFQKTRIDYPSISQLLSFDPGGTKEVVLNEKFEQVVETAKHRSLTLGDYKIIYMPMAEHVVYKLFNRRQDPDNLHDLTVSEPQTFLMMKEKLMAKLQEFEGADRLVNSYVVPK